MLKSVVMRGAFVRPKIGIAICVVSGFGAQVASAADSFDPSQYALGDWGGVRSELYQKGYEFSVEYVGEAAANLRGGYNKDHTARYSDQVALGTKWDLQKIAGWEDALFQLTITERSGRNLANDRISDPRAGMLSTPQEVYGRGQTWRLTQMWLSKGWMDDRLNVKFGQFGEGEDFNTFPCDFQNNAFCGPQAANWAGSVWYNWPVAQWGLRVKYALSSEVYAQIGAFEVNPSNLEVGNGFKLSGSGTKGTLIPAEVVWTPKVNGLPGEYRLGGYYSSAKAADVYEGANGEPQALSGGDFRSRGSKKGGWVVVQQQLTARDGDASRGLSMFFNATVHDRQTNLVDNFLQAGLVYKGLFDSRPLDDFGVGVARIHVNKDVAKGARLANEMAGIDNYDDPRYMPVRHSEWDAEIHYGFVLTPWFTIRPNLQYVVQPGGVKEVDDALIAGVKFITKF